MQSFNPRPPLPLPRVSFALSFRPPSPWQHPRYYFISHSRFIPSFQLLNPNRRIVLAFSGGTSGHATFFPPSSFPPSFSAFPLFHLYTISPAVLALFLNFHSLFTASCNKTSKLFRSRGGTFVSMHVPS